LTPDKRGAALADEAPGGSSGLILKLCSHGKAIHKIDGFGLDLIRLLLKIGKRAAQEVGHWRERRLIQKETGYGATERGIAGILAGHSTFPSVLPQSILLTFMKSALYNNTRNSVTNASGRVSKNTLPG
jgi:hypothetical protein